MSTGLSSSLNAFPLEAPRCIEEFIVDSFDFRGNYPQAAEVKNLNELKVARRELR